jgi:hypothetical protein
MSVDPEDRLVDEAAAGSARSLNGQLRSGSSTDSTRVC